MFVFGDVLRIQAWICLRRLALASGIQFGFGCVVCTFGKALRMLECEIVLGLCRFRESREKSGSTVRSAGKSWKLGGGKVFVSFWLAGGAHGRRRDSHGVVWCLMDGYDGFVIDIYSCNRP